MSSARIADVSILRFKSPIHVPFTISKESLPAAEIIIIRLQDSNGHIALGEASPFPTLTGDTIEIAERTAKEIGALIIGKTVQEAFAVLAALSFELGPVSVTAMSGIEIALWDLQARQLEKPLSALCGNANQPLIESDITLPIMTPDRVSNFWDVFGDYEFRVVKIKVSGNISEDMDMILSLAQVAERKKIALRYTLDGNQSYTVDSALALLNRLDLHGIIPECFEQPLPESDWSGLAKLSLRTSIPICLDETVKSVADCTRVINEKTATMINLKIMKSGFGECLDIARLAKSVGLGLMIGGMLESEIAMTASLNLACGLGGIQQCDLDTPFFFVNHPTESSPWHRKNARLQKSIGPGLDLDLDIKLIPSR